MILTDLRSSMSLNKVFRVRNDHFKDLTEVKNLLIRAENGEFSAYISKDPPVKPKGGEIFLYIQKNVNDRFYLDDQYQGMQQYGSNKNRKNDVLKVYYALKEFSGISPFSKCVYKLREPTSTDHPIVIIHYVGDESVWVPRPHGNCKTEKPYTRNSSRVKTEIRRKLEETGKLPKRVYHSVLKSSTRELIDSNPHRNPELEAVVTPRNVKQVKNIKFKQTSERRLLNCEIFSIVEMAKNQDLGKCILLHQLIPSHIIILSEPAILELANHLLKLCNKDLFLHQELNYDTTFECGYIYVSVLVMRNTLLENDPIFPIAFMLHDRKLASVHLTFWRIISSELPQLAYLEQGIPICIDREKAMISAILSVYPNANLVYCHNHLKRDLKLWLQKATGTTSDDKKVLLEQFKCLLSMKSEEAFDVKLKEYTDMWSKPFVEYMLDNIIDDVKSGAAAYIVEKFAAYRNRDPTNNLSESMNAMIHLTREWKELPLDFLVLTLQVMFLEFILEFSRAHRGLGNYTLKISNGSMPFPVVCPSYTSATVDDLLNLLKCNLQHTNNVLKDPEQKYLLTKKALAELCCSEQLVSLNSKTHTFQVRHPFKDSLHTVKRNVKTGSMDCSCPSSGFCYHRIAVYRALGMELPEDKFNYKLSVLMKKSKGYTGKTGRKTPKPQDFELAVDPAPDSVLATGCAALPKK